MKRHFAMKNHGDFTDKSSNFKQIPLVEKD